MLITHVAHEAMVTIRFYMFHVTTAWVVCCSKFFDVPRSSKIIKTTFFVERIAKDFVKVKNMKLLLVRNNLFKIVN